MNPENTGPRLVELPGAYVARTKWRGALIVGPALWDGEPATVSYWVRKKDVEYFLNRFAGEAALGVRA